MARGWGRNFQQMPLPSGSTARIPNCLLLYSRVRKAVFPKLRLRTEIPSWVVCSICPWKRTERIGRKNSSADECSERKENNVNSKKQKDYVTTRRRFEGTGENHGFSACRKYHTGGCPSLLVLL